MNLKSRIVLALLGIVVVGASVASAPITPVANPGPRHNFGSPDGTDPAIWISDSADQGLATAFSMHGTLSSPDGMFRMSMASSLDGADYQETISPREPTPHYFECWLDLASHIMVKVDPHVADPDTSYRTTADSVLSCQYWCDGVLSYQDFRLIEAERVPEDAAAIAKKAHLHYSASIFCETLKLVYRASGLVYMSTNRPEITLHAQAATNHGDPSDPIGYVQKYAGGPPGAPVGSRVELR